MSNDEIKMMRNDSVSETFFTLSSTTIARKEEAASAIALTRKEKT